MFCLYSIAPSLTPHHEFQSVGESSVSKSELIVAAVIPSLFSLALLLAFSILSMLFYSKIRKKHTASDTTTSKDYCNEEVTYEEIQKKTSTTDHAFNMDAVKVEKNSAYGMI